MAHKIKSSFIIFLFIINVIGISIIYILLYYYSYDINKRSSKEMNKIEYNKSNHKIINDILLNNGKINTTENLHNNTHSYSSKDKIKMSKRRLSIGFYDFYSYIMIINSLYAFFCLILLFSFFVRNDERVVCCYRSAYGFQFLCFGYYRCDHDLICFQGSSRGNGFFMFTILLMIIFFFFVGIYFIAKFLGKILARYFSLISFIIINFINILICLSNINDNDNGNIYKKNILLISAVLLIFNISGVLLPNLKCFKILRSESDNKKPIPLRGSTDISKSGVNNLPKSIHSNNAVNVKNDNNYYNKNNSQKNPEQNSEKSENATKIIEKSTNITNIEDISLSVTRRDFTSDRKSIGKDEMPNKT